MVKLVCISSVVSILILCAAIEIAAPKDITPDAVTMATSRNPWVGELAWLTDGHTPDIDSQAPGVQWEWIGLVAVSWPDTVRLVSIEVYLGELHQYRLFGYLGGSFTEEGLRLGQEVAAFGCEATLSETVAGWYRIPCASDLPVDNISFQMVGGSLIYEMRFLTSNGTAIQSSRFGAIKMAVFNKH